MSVDLLITTIGRPSLEQAIVAGLHQTLADTRIVVVSDGLKGAWRICKAFCSRERPLHFVERPQPMGRGNLVKEWWINSGNAGEFVKFLDDDDWMPPTALADMMEPMSNPKVVLTLCPMVVAYAPEGHVLRSRIHQPAMARGLGACQALVRTSAARGVAFKNVPDSDFFWLQEIAAKGEVVTLKHPLYFYNAYRTNAQRGPFGSVA